MKDVMAVVVVVAVAVAVDLLIDCSLRL